MGWFKWRDVNINDESVEMQKIEGEYERVDNVIKMDQSIREITLIGE